MYFNFNIVSHSHAREIINETNNINNNQNIHQISQINNDRASTNINRNQTINNNNNYFHDNSLNNYSSSDYMINNEELSHSYNYFNRNFDSQLDEIFDQLNYAIKNEKQNLKNEKYTFLKDKQKFINFKKNERLKLEKEKDQFEENLKIIQSINIIDTDILDLDIGGIHKISTSRSTLIKVIKSCKFSTQILH
jgi:hypothetical protein